MKKQLLIPLESCGHDPTVFPGLNGLWTSKVMQDVQDLLNTDSKAQHFTRSKANVLIISNFTFQWVTSLTDKTATAL